MPNNKSTNNSTNNRRQNDRRTKTDGTPPPGTVIDRRLGIDQRNRTDPRTKSTTPQENSGKLVSSKKQIKTRATDHPSMAQNTTGLERKRGRGRRLSEFTKSAEEGEMTTEQFLFLMAIDAFKKGNDRMFPTWTDVLEVVRLLGYRKTMGSELNLSNAEDWQESPDAPANVRPDRWASRFTAEESDMIKVGSSSPSNSSFKGPKSEAELTDEALEAFEAAFGDSDDLNTDFDTDLNDPTINEDLTDFDEDFTEAA